MRILFVVNEALEVEGKQTTARLMAEAVRRGHAVSVAGVDDLGWGDPGGAGARARGLGFEAPEVAEAVPAALGRAEPRSLALSAVDLVWIRTNPGRDLGRGGIHRDALALLGIAQRGGPLVLNAPEALLSAGGKMLLFALPAEMRPASLVATDQAAVRAFVAERPGEVVIKPVHGTRGAGVFRVGEGGDGLEASLTALSGQAILAQDCVPGFAAGDTRVVVAGGRVLRSGGRPAAVRRVPAAGEWRSNMHLGGEAAPADWTPALEALCEAAARRLQRLGIWTAGLDVVGDRIIEVNVHAPGGLGSAAAFEGVDFVPALVAAAEAERVRRG